MLETYELKQIVEPLLQWFRENKRDLPWRHDMTPYRIWVSEIMLQQTRVEAVKPYFQRFMESLPDIKSLAECPEDKLLKLWEGLGYYSRVRNMQVAARTIMEEHGGCMPADFKAIRNLKGIGSYTAGAIASNAFGIPAPAVDGNVLRVIMRLAADDSDIMKQSVKSRVETALAPVIPECAPGEFNQALMELGAIVCVPNSAPLCDRCPCSRFCLCCRDNLWQALPVRVKKTKRRIENRTVLLIKDGRQVLLQKRPDTGLLAGLYELPNVEGELTEEQAFRTVEAMGLEPVHIRKVENAKHIFSHVEWHMRGYLIQVGASDVADDLLFTSPQDYPIPSAFKAYRKYIE